MKQKFKYFGWNTLEINGHDHKAIFKACMIAKQKSKKPTMIIANTIKGKGVSFMEDDNNWHYRTPTINEVIKAKKELKI